MNSTNLKQGWHVLYVKSRQEKKANTILNDQNIETFLPLIKTVRQWSDRKKEIEVPLFPSYLFVNLKRKLDFEKILACKGFCFFLKIGREYAKITKKEISNIKLFLNSEHLKDIECLENNIKFKKGDLCIIDNGPLKGLYCQVIRLDKKNRVSVFIESLNKTIVASISRKSLIAS